MMRRRLHLAIGVALLAAVAFGPLSAYSLSGHYWGVHDVRYYVNPVNADMSQAAAIAAIQAAAANWTEQSNANVRLVYAGTTTGSSLLNNRKNEVFFRSGSNGSMYGATYFWYGGDGKLLDADTLLYDGGVRFYPGSSGCASGQYLEDIATHEFGHFLGLRHSSVTGATMYPSLNVWCSQAWRTLSSDDRTAIEKAYPGGSSTTSPTPTTAPAAPSNPSPANGATNVQTSAVAWSAAARATSYDVYFGTSSTPPRKAAGVITTSLNVGSLARGTKYYWRVVARNSAGATSSATWSFTTRTKPSGGKARGKGRR